MCETVLVLKEEDLRGYGDYGEEEKYLCCRKDAWREQEERGDMKLVQHLPYAGGGC